MTIGISRLLKGFKEYLEANYDVTIKLLDEVDYSKKDTLAVYIDYNWRDLYREKILKTVPKEKRVLFLLEPSNVNPLLYLVPWIRNRFHTVVTWDEKLLSKNKDYKPIVVNPFEEPVQYAADRFKDIHFADKKLLIAVAAYRKNFMPWSNYRRRNALYEYFDRELPDDFDLYGNCWDESRFKSVYRGPLKQDSAGLVAHMAHYKFCLCYENNASEPGYVSEKISNCICARCVPIYYGSKGIEKRVPRECFIDARQFRSKDEMKRFISEMSAEKHHEYVDAMNLFCRSDLAKKFTRKYFFDRFAEAVSLHRKIVSPSLDGCSGRFEEYSKEVRS